MKSLKIDEKFIAELIKDGLDIVEIIKDFPDKKKAIARVLYKTMSLGVIRAYFAEAGITISRQGIHTIVGDIIIREVKPICAPRSRRPISDIKKKQIVTLFNKGTRTDDIRKTLRVDFYTILMVLAENGISSSRNRRPVEIGDVFGNWIVIGYCGKGDEKNRGKCRCRDMRNGEERFVTYQNLRKGSSKGCRELRAGNTKAKE
jgi:hypothetical protein